MSEDPSTPPIPVHWALWGKEPHGTGYKILDCSDDQDGFATVMTRYPVGAQGGGRTVSIIRIGSGPNAFLGIGIQDPTDQVDWSSRPVVAARYYTVTFEDLRRTPVSYEGMYRALEGCTSPHGGAFMARFPTLNTGEIASNVTELALRTSALLMTDTHVCVVGARSVPLEERLRFIDTVAALLPYGMRPQLTASTWASSTGEHKFRLYFAENSRENVYAVDWVRGAEIPRDAALANWYLALLREHESHWPTLMERLSHASEEILFKRPDLQAVNSILRGGVPADPAPPASPPSPPKPRPVAEIFTDLDAALSPDDRGDVQADHVESLLRELSDIPAATEERGWTHYQNLIKRHGLLEHNPWAGRHITSRLYRELLRIAFPPNPGPADLPRVEELSGQPLPADLRDVLADRSGKLCLLLTPSLDQNIAAEIVAGLPTDELVALAAGWPPLPANTLDVVCDHLGGRPPRELRKPLRDSGYLVSAMAYSFEKDAARQYRHLVGLLRALELDNGQIEKIFYEIARDLPLWGVLQAAFIPLDRERSMERLVDLTIWDPIERAGLAKQVKERALDDLHEAAPRRSHRRARSWHRRRGDKNRLEDNDAGPNGEPAAAAGQEGPPGSVAALFFGTPSERRSRSRDRIPAISMAIFIGLLIVLIVLLFGILPQR